jgi:hypothetical protein
VSDEICNGKCNAGARRQLADYDRALTAWQREMAAWVDAPEDERGPEPVKPVEPSPRWMLGSPYWCLQDAASVRSALTDLDEQMALRLLAGDGHGSLNLNERVSGSSEPTSPSPAHDQLDELVRWLRDWEASYRVSQGWPTAPHRGEAAPALTTCVAWLTAHLDGILAHPEYAVGFGEGVLSWHNEITAAAKTKPRRVTKQMRCPQCHLATLSQLEGEDRIECRNRDCGVSRGGPKVMTTAEYEGLADAVIEASKRWAS